MIRLPPALSPSGILLSLLAGAFAWTARTALADFPALALKGISVNQIVSPVFITNAGDSSNRIFVCDQAGQIRIIRDEMLLPTPFLDLASRMVPKAGAGVTYLFPLSTSYDERGLLSMAFHPNFNKKNANNQPLPGFGRFYVFYSAPSPNAQSGAAPVNCRTTISEFQVSSVSPDIADPASERVVLAFDKPQMNHNGGQLQFGPDGFLYISVGDGGSQHDNDAGHTGGAAGSPINSGNLGNAQDKTRPFGKLLRIDPLGSNGPTGKYGIPAGNPFATTGGGVLPEIYAFGLRNPWRFSFDDGPGGTNRLFEGDVGQDTVEEVNVVTSGGNYGWRVKEGTFDHDATDTLNGGLPFLAPIAQYAHVGKVTTSPTLPQIGSSITGGYLYRGATFAALAGKYLFGDYSHSIGGAASGTLLGLEEVPAGSNNWLFSVPVVAGGNPLTTRIYSFGRDEAGEVYVATKVTKGPFELDANGAPTGGIYKVVAPVLSTAVLTPSKDNTIFSELPANSDAGGLITAGRTTSATALRRGLLAFNVATGLPANAVIVSAKLDLNLAAAGPAATANTALYPLTQDWGEGTSDPQGTGTGTGVAASTGDATWPSRFYDPATPTAWSTAGGAFSSTASASTSVGQTTGDYSWSSPQMALDVQSWVNSAGTASPTNFGWILVGDENTNQSARRFSSRESAVGLRPALTVVYNPGVPPLNRRESWLRQYFPTVGAFVDDLADLDGDGVPNLLEYAFAFSPLASNSPKAGLSGSVSTAGASSVFTITFRRDPRATDLSYFLQTSSDLVGWTNIVTSAAGAVPTGSGFISETDAAGEAPVKVVTASETLTSPARRFTRLKVVRVPQQ